jgi:transcriptional regulator with XRE-family HTH domain
MEGIAEKIKILLLKRKMNQTELATHLGMTLQNLNNKLRRESFTAEELNTIATALGASYSEKAWFTLNDTGEEI